MNKFKVLFSENIYDTLDKPNKNERNSDFLLFTKCFPITFKCDLLFCSPS